MRHKIRNCVNSATIIVNMKRIDDNITRDVTDRDVPTARIITS